MPNISNEPIDKGISIFGLNERLQRTIKYVPNTYPIPKKDGIDTYKIFIPRNYGTGKFEDTLFKTVLAGPNDICTETFIQIYPFKTEEERNACNKYLRTKFFRILVCIRKQDQGAGRDVYKFVPIQEFTPPKSDIDWSQSVPEIDRQLYAKYHLSEEEIAFIERMIKPM